MSYNRAFEIPHLNHYSHNLPLSLAQFLHVGKVGTYLPSPFLLQALDSLCQELVPSQEEAGSEFSV